MSDFDDIEQQLLQLAGTVNELKQTKSGRYSAELEKPYWQERNADFAINLLANIGRYRGRLTLLQTSTSVPVEQSKLVLTKLSETIIRDLQFYSKQTSNTEEKSLCAQLVDQLNKTVNVITNYSRPSTPGLNL